MILEIVVEALACLLSWRAWLCLLAMLGFAFVLNRYEIWFVWPSDVFIVAGILGLALGLYWEQRVG
jgi:hypothetical protein